MELWKNGMKRGAYCHGPTVPMRCFQRRIQRNNKNNLVSSRRLSRSALALRTSLMINVRQLSHVVIGQGLDTIYGVIQASDGQCWDVSRDQCTGPMETMLLAISQALFKTYRVGW
ncbi:hypothetical protein PHJA_002059700 [Phtheirospermum japonicum]|uniref:Uncharacterized protein n=1 Tax=Phtheirospermum japonicum TaxID=374723 RepID=A0A830CNX6_9LAMI|nr:hypothetical protein PHJA_002059700 [Phtheirospermum japonicum]